MQGFLKEFKAAAAARRAKKLRRVYAMCPSRHQLRRRETRWLHTPSEKTAGYLHKKAN
jgi:hypothetical protein